MNLPYYILWFPLGITCETNIEKDCVVWAIDYTATINAENIGTNANEVVWSPYWEEFCEG